MKFDRSDPPVITRCKMRMRLPPLPDLYSVTLKIPDGSNKLLKDVIDEHMAWLEEKLSEDKENGYKSSAESSLKCNVYYADVSASLLQTIKERPEVELVCLRKRFYLPRD